MDLDTYQFEAKQSRLPQCRKIEYLALGLAGETGEVVELIKKYLRSGQLDVRDVEAELGDVLWYLANLADILGLSLRSVAQTNLDKLNKRYPNRERK